MRLLFFILVLGWLLLGFSEVFAREETNGWKIIILFLFSPFILAIENIKVALRKK